jgi:NDP-sugar pyrophosphorylase family protein
MRAVVLSAGYGTRLGELTEGLPKPLLPVAGRPILEHIIRNLVWHGFDEIAINLHFRPELIREHFGDGSALGARLTYSYEPELLGTAGALASLRPFLADGPFIAHYGDVLTDHDFTAMLRFHRERQALLTLLVHKRSGSNSVVVLDNEQHVVEFIERPPADHPARQRPAWVNSGICICDPSLLDFISEPPSDLARDVLPLLVSRRDVYAHPVSGIRVAVDSRERYREAEQMFADTVEDGR